MSLSHEVVIVTGASAGIGEAISRRLADKNAKLILVARRRERLEKLAAQLPTASVVIANDIRNSDEILAEIEKLPQEFRNVTALINNAGLALGKDPVQESNPDDWDVMIDTNIRALIRLTRGVLPKMLAQNKGYIIQLGSVAGSWPYGGGHVYCGTKAFIRQFSLAIRTDLLGTPIRVTNIEPGLVETEFSLVRFKGDQERANATYSNTVALTPDDIAANVVWCLEQPPHVNITSLEILPTAQSLAGFLVAPKNEL